MRKPFLDFLFRSLVRRFVVTLLRAEIILRDEMAGMIVGVLIAGAMAEAHRMTEAGAFFEVNYGGGVLIHSRSLFVCRDPADGRAFFANRPRKEGGT